MLVSLVPIIALGWWVADFASSVLEEEVQQSIGRAGEIQAERVNNSVLASLGYLGQITNDPSFLRAVDRQGSLDNTTESTQFFRDFVAEQFEMDADDGLVGLGVFTIGGGEPRLAGDIGSATAFLRTRIPEGENTIIGEAFLTEDGDARLPVARRVRGTNNDGSSVTIVAEWSIDAMVHDAIDPATLGESARSLIAQQNTDGSMTVVAGSDRNLLGEIIALSTNPVVGEGTVAQSDEPLAGLSPVVQATTRVPGDPGWVSIIEIDESEIFAELEAIRSRLITVFIAAGVAILLVVVFGVRGFVRRLGRVSDLASSIADGDLTVRIGDHRGDELGRLSTAFDDMASSLAIDIARREQIEEQLAYQATHDALTGLPNRSQLVHQLDQILSDKGETVSCLFVDLDGFKAVNDRLGHGAGDELLIRVGERLSDVLRPSDFLARLGGDEFVVILRGLGPVASEHLAGRIVAALELPFVVSDEEVQISASIGVASASDDHTTERLIKEADIGMYRAKAKGRGRAVRVTDETMREVDERVTMLAELREAVAHDQLELTLVPMADLRDGSLRSVETAVRWHHPTRGLVTASEFEQMIADSGTAQQLDEWVVLQSTKLFASWRDAGLPVADIDLVDQPQPARIRRLPRPSAAERTDRTPWPVARQLPHRGVGEGVAPRPDDLARGVRHVPSCRRLRHDRLLRVGLFESRVAAALRHRRRQDRSRSGRRLDQPIVEPSSCELTHHARPDRRAAGDGCGDRRRGDPHADDRARLLLGSGHVVLSARPRNRVHRCAGASPPSRLVLNRPSAIEGIWTASRVVRPRYGSLHDHRDERSAVGDERSADDDRRHSLGRRRRESIRRRWPQTAG